MEHRGASAGVGGARTARQDPKRSYGLTGYDPFQRKYLGVWADSGSPALYWTEARSTQRAPCTPKRLKGLAAADVLDAFSADGVLDATFALPEFGPDATVPGAMAIGFHFVDYVVHGWDAASDIERILLHLGRSPKWVAAQR